MGITIFSLVTFYYSLNGPNWFVQTNWLQSNTDICDWYGINCETEEKQYPMEMETMTTLLNTEKKVRTSTSKSNIFIRGGSSISSISDSDSNDRRRTRELQAVSPTESPTENTTPSPTWVPTDWTWSPTVVGVPTDNNSKENENLNFDEALMDEDDDDDNNNDGDDAPETDVDVVVVVDDDDNDCTLGADDKLKLTTQDKKMKCEKIETKELCGEKVKNEGDKTAAEFCKSCGCDAPETPEIPETPEDVDGDDDADNNNSADDNNVNIITFDDQTFLVDDAIVNQDNEEDEEYYKNTIPIRSINLLANNLEGTLPAELGLLTNVYELIMLNINQIYGSIPSSLLMLSKLQGIDLSSNQLQSTLPSELSSMLDIRLFDISNNNDITGTFPSEFKQWTNLEKLYIQNTSLSGSVPVEFCSMIENRDPVNYEYKTNTNGVTGDDLVIKASCPTPLVCDCCTECELDNTNI